MSWQELGAVFLLCRVPGAPGAGFAPGAFGFAFFVRLAPAGTVHPAFIPIHPSILPVPCITFNQLILPCYSFPCLPSSSSDLFPKWRSLVSSSFPSPSFNPFAFKLLHTLFCNGAHATLFFSIDSALFPSQRGWGGMKEPSPSTVTLHCPVYASRGLSLYFLTSLRHYLSLLLYFQ